MPKYSRFQSREGLVPDRFREARLARGMTAQDLADRVGVTRQSISKYELGISEPTANVINSISEELDLPVSFFYKPLSAPSNRGTTFFRSLKTNAARAKEVMSTKSVWADAIYNFLSSAIIFPDIDIPSIPSEFENHESFSLEDIETIANHVRMSWGLGNAPISNISHTLESHGIILASIKTGFIETDACSSIINGRPFIFLDTEKECAVRNRFNLAHELGHLILHKTVQQTDLESKIILDRIEREAHQFASCFLLPRDSFLLDIRSTSLQSFIPLKKKWKVSIQAMVYRCKELEIFSESQMIYIQKQISANHWRKNEPLDDVLPCEKPIVLSKAVNMLIDREDYTKDQLIELFRLSPKDIETICSLPEGFFSNEALKNTIIVDFATRSVIKDQSK